MDSVSKTWRTNNDDDSTEDRRLSQEEEFFKNSNSQIDINKQSKINELNIKLRESEIDN